MFTVELRQVLLRKIQFLSLRKVHERPHRDFQTPNVLLVVRRLKPVCEALGEG